MTINDGFGEPEVTADEWLADLDGWLRGAAIRMLDRGDDPRLHDLIQEGRIALWKAYGELAEEPEPNRTRYSMHRARQRMKHYVFRDEPSTGHEPMVGHVEVKPVISVQAPLNEDGVTLADLLEAVEGLEGVEMAYHHGEIMAAFQALTPGQQRYVYARFWCGMDATDGMNANRGMKEARANNPFLRRDVYWTGNKTTAGAKKRLAEALAHLEGVFA